MSRAALAGAPREELVREALDALTKDGRADRIGVWIHSRMAETAEGNGQMNFRGQVHDQSTETPPAEWARLSGEAPLPMELLAGGRSVESDLEGPGNAPLIGPLVEMRRAVWVPIVGKHRLRGLLLAASRDKRGTLPRASLESVAAELALALEYEDEQRIACERHADLTMARRILASLEVNEPADTILANLAESCTAGEPHGTPPCAVFSAIGRIRESPSQAEGKDAIEFAWKSGDPVWIRAIESEPLSQVWQKTVETRRVAGMEVHVAWAQSEVSRIVAIPLEAENAMAGVLVAGLPRRVASLAALERLELRAMLAASALAQKKRSEQEARNKNGPQALLGVSREALLLLDAQGRILGRSLSTHQLLGGALAGTEASPLPLHFSELFSTGEGERVESWLRGLPASAQDSGEQSLEAELKNSVRVVMRGATMEDAEFIAVLLEPLQVPGETPPSGRAETELHSVIEWLEEGVVLFDAQENVRAMNTRFAQMAGLSTDESARRTTLEALITRLSAEAAEPENFAQSWRELAQGGAEGGLREELQMALPAPRVLERASRPILEEDGRRLGRVEIYRDVTAHRAFQSKLLQTEKLAALGQMVFGIAHELSNPLTTILGHAQRLLAQDTAGGRSEEARQIYQEAGRASKILRQLLLTARDSRPERRLVSLNQIVLRTMELQRFHLSADKIRLEMDLDPCLPPVRGDAGQLQQVLMNLVGNAQQAIDHSGQGGTIWVRTKRNPGQRVLFEVSDDGPGIPTEVVARIFDPFFTTKPPGVGTGLGLAIVLSIVREHGGRINVVSPRGGGAKFSIELPAAQTPPFMEMEENRRRAASRESPPAEFPEAAAPASEAAASQPAHVLLVEDEPTVARLIADVLQDEGMRVDVMLDGREALKRAARESYDLTICDMKMPGLDGQHFFQMLARTGNPLRERMLFVTGDVIAPHTREFLERNHLPHVAKPFRVEELTGAVRRVLAGKATHRPTNAVMAKKRAARSG